MFVTNEINNINYYLTQTFLQHKKKTTKVTQRKNYNKLKFSTTPPKANKNRSIIHDVALQLNEIKSTGGCIRNKLFKNKILPKCCPQNLLNRMQKHTTTRELLIFYCDVKWKDAKELLKIASNLVGDKGDTDEIHIHTIQTNNIIMWGPFLFNMFCFS